MRPFLLNAPDHVSVATGLVGRRLSLGTSDERTIDELHATAKSGDTDKFYVLDRTLYLNCLVSSFEMISDYHAEVSIEYNESIDLVNTVYINVIHDEVWFCEAAGKDRTNHQWKHILKCPNKNQHVAFLKDHHDSDMSHIRARAVWHDLTKFGYKQIEETQYQY